MLVFRIVPYSKDLEGNNEFAFAAVDVGVVPLIKFVVDGCGGGTCGGHVGTLAK
jgi:hypothetical protein